MKLLFLSCLLFLSLLGCRQSPNGTYLIYKEIDELNALQMASPVTDVSTEVNKRLNSVLMGKSFSFDFQEEYIILKSDVSAYDNIILNKKIGYEKIEYYYGQRVFGNTTLKFRLMPNDTQYLIMAVDVDIPFNTPIVIPTQLGGPFTTSPPRQIGRVIFNLKKVQ